MLEKIGRRLYTITLLTLLFSLIIGGASVPTVKAQGTKVNVDPSSLVWGSDDQPVPSTSFTITITVTDVAELFMWEIKLYFDPTIIDTTTEDMSYPPDHVFASVPFTPMPAVVKTDAKGKYAQMCASAQGGYHFTGPFGKLCIINFTAVAPGTSNLNFSKPWIEGEEDPETYLMKEPDPLDPGYIPYIPFGVTEGTITVKGQIIEKEPSTITISATPSTTHIGHPVTIQGEIQPKRPNARVIMKYRPFGWPDFDPLNETTTDNESIYTYIWMPQEAGLYELYSFWTGDATTYSDESDIVNVTVRVPHTNLAIVGPDRVGNYTMDLPTPPFNLTIQVINVTDLYAWQVRLKYDPRILQAINASIPPGNVFEGKEFTAMEPTINETTGYILCNASLNAGETTFNGNGTILEIVFRGIFANNTALGTREREKYLYGISPLTFDDRETYLLDSYGEIIPTILEATQVTVVSKAKILSVIGISLDPEEIVLGDVTKIIGWISTADQIPRPNATVTIQCKPKGELWENLTQVTTDSESRFSFIWKPENATEYEVKSRWEGDNDTMYAESVEVILKVHALGTTLQGEIDPFPYALTGVIIYLCALVVVFVKKVKEE